MLFMIWHNIVRTKKQLYLHCEHGVDTDVKREQRNRNHRIIEMIPAVSSLTSIYLWVSKYKHGISFSHTESSQRSDIMKHHNHSCS